MNSIALYGTEIYALVNKILHALVASELSHASVKLHAESGKSRDF